jgi:AcrR family transcriptional regulator
MRKRMIAQMRKLIYGGRMGNREALLAGAKRCLYERGYTRPTSRDIAAAAGVSMGAISYHFGSREALLNEALIQANVEWGAEVEAAIAAGAAPGESPAARFERIWSGMLESLASHRGLWAANLEAFSQTNQAPQVHAQLTAALTQARLGLARVFHPTSLAADEAWKLGSIYQALLTGLALQWLADPEHALSGRDLANALQTISARVEPQDHPAASQRS